MVVKNETDLISFVNSKKPKPLIISVKQIRNIFKGKLTVLESDNRFEIKHPQFSGLSLILPFDLPYFVIPYDKITLSGTGKTIRLGLDWEQLFAHIFSDDIDNVFETGLLKGNLLLNLNHIYRAKIIRLPMIGIEVPKELQDIVGSPIAYSFEAGKFRFEIQQRVEIIQSFLQQTR
jgi:hypothetical protein